MKLAAKLILIFLFGVFGIVALFTWQTIRRQYVWEQERRKSHASDLVTAVMPEIMRAYRDGGALTIQHAVEITSQTVPGSNLRWIEGSDPESGTQVSTRSVSSVSVVNPDGTRIAYSYVPFSMDGQDAGTIEVAESLDEHDAFTRNSILASILSMLGVAALSAIVIYYGGVRLVGKPLDKLITQVNSIGEGNLAQPAILSSGDELGRLASAISLMSQRLSEQRDTIRHADRITSVGTLAAGVAHELGTPLNVVSGRAGLIASGRLSPEEVVASAHTIKSESERMTKIIRQLLDFARQDPGPHATIDLREIVTRTCGLMRQIAEKSSVTIRFIGDEEPVMIEGDAAQMQQVITNLVSNAVAAMPDGGEVQVSLSQPPDSDCVSLQVTDFGVGIESEHISRIFEPFYTTKDVGQGTGLGLSIAYGIVKEHGGEIKVSSFKGRQTTFAVTLPRAKQEQK
ncbi:MAG: HAMP domain-containing histidine kinase [Planctomycetales bacterium]|nr:HAMP domain-containing histidine kinase [Planctomycetales bacterium]